MSRLVLALSFLSAGVAGLTTPAAAQVDSTSVEDVPVTLDDRLAEAPHAEAPPTAPYKDPVLGHVFGYLLTGGGHFYAGETGTGVMLLAVSATGALITVNGLQRFANNCAFGSDDCSSLDPSVMLAGLGMIVGAQVYSIVDGGRAVRRANVRNGHMDGRPRVAVAASPGGVALRVRL